MWLPGMPGLQGHLISSWYPPDVSDLNSHHLQPREPPAVLFRKMRVVVQPIWRSPGWCGGELSPIHLRAEASSHRLMWLKCTDSQFLSFILTAVRNRNIDKYKSCSKARNAITNESVLKVNELKRSQTSCLDMFRTRNSHDHGESSRPHCQVSLALSKPRP